LIRDLGVLDAFRETVRRFVADKLVPREEEVAREDRMPAEIVSAMRELGLFGLSIPEEYGGLGFTMEEEVTLAFELGQTSPAFRSLFATNVGIGSQSIIIDGTAGQKAKYLPRLASGELIGSFCLTEPDVGSDAGSVKASAVREGDHYRLNGTKRFITNAPSAGLFTVMARTDPDKAGAAGVSAFLVERNTPGLSIGKPEKKMGQQGAQVADVMMDNCIVPADALIGGREGEGFKTAMRVLDRGRLHIAAVCVGVAERLIRESVTYASERRQFGAAIAGFQLIQAMIADSRTGAYAARAMILDAARRKDDGEPIIQEAACAKLFASEMVGRVADRAVQIFGGAGYIADYGIERFYRDVRLFRIYEGTSQIQQLVIAREEIRRQVGKSA
jgi:acyl-CoA dehydrogenase